MLKSKDLLGLKSLTESEIELILDTAADMKLILKSENKRTNSLLNKTVATLFYENSTRTRTSFEIAAKYMGANVSSITVAQSSVSKGETLIDTGKTLDALLTDFIIIRHSVSGAPHLLAKNVKASVINGGDGSNEHPTQALLDMFTMREMFGKLSGLKVALIGDIKHSRVAKSNIFGLKKMNAEVSIAAPCTLLPNDIEKIVRVYTSAEDAVKDADVIMGLRIQTERQKKGLFPSAKEFHKFYGINTRLVKLANKKCIVMHPGPINRGIEISSSIADSGQSTILNQVTNGLAVRMAVLQLLNEVKEVSN